MKRQSGTDFTLEQAARIKRLLLGGERQPITVHILVDGKIEEVPLDQFAPGEEPLYPTGGLPDAEFRRRYGRKPGL